MRATITTTARYTSSASNNHNTVVASGWSIQIRMTNAKHGAADAEHVHVTGDEARHAGERAAGTGLVADLFERTGGARPQERATLDGPASHAPSAMISPTRNTIRFELRKNRTTMSNAASFAARDGRSQGARRDRDRARRQMPNPSTSAAITMPDAPAEDHAAAVAGEQDRGDTEHDDEDRQHDRAACRAVRSRPAPSRATRRRRAEAQRERPDRELVEDADAPFDERGSHVDRERRRDRA